MITQWMFAIIIFHLSYDERREMYKKEDAVFHGLSVSNKDRVRKKVIYLYVVLRCQRLGRNQLSGKQFRIMIYYVLDDLLSVCKRVIDIYCPQLQTC